MEKQEIVALLKKYLAGTLTIAEESKLESWYTQYAANSDLQASPEEMTERLQEIASRLPLGRQVSKQRGIGPYLSAAAAVLVIALCIYFYQQGFFGAKGPAASHIEDIAPGSNRAILTLADGTKINLDSAKAGIQVKDQLIHYNDGTSIGVNAGSDTPGNSNLKRITYNSLSTPKGGQYMVILSDGSKVWLNAASTLTYPSSFFGETRSVELSGEGYFEIAKASQPFVVKSKGQDIRVLATTFNLNAYDDESSVKTTLVDGAVQVANDTDVSGFGLPASSYKRLSPGQQAVNTGGKLRIKTVNVNSEVAWRKGLFRFNQEPLESVMRQVSRWYNVEVHFEDESLKTETIEGIVNRFSNLSTLLRLFEMAGDLQFTLQDHRLTVRRK